jgi:hypothetical protein
MADEHYMTAAAREQIRQHLDQVEASESTEDYARALRHWWDSLTSLEPCTAGVDLIPELNARIERFYAEHQDSDVDV